MTTPIETYRALAQEGTLKADPAQELAAEALTLLHNRLRTVRRPGRESAGRLRGLFSRKGGGTETETRTDYQGLYMFGGVGRGKSMLMDLFFEGAPITPKRRIHFHEFMIEVHAHLHRWRGQSKSERAAEWGKAFAKADDPIPPVAKLMADKAQLLCFDEFQVTDVADAMILSRLFTHMFGHGVWVVATSNRAPRDLYLGGLNRPLFEPFIALIYERLDVLHLESPNDYRLERLQGAPVYLSPLNGETAQALDNLWLDLTGQATGEPRTLEMQGRTLLAERTHNGVARFGFAELCARPLGAADYLAIAEAFHTVVLDDIPALSPAKRNEAKRFVTLIDALYEKRVKLICTADAPVENLYPKGDGAFEFERTVSRLMEMQSADYLALAHLV